MERYRATAIVLMDARSRRFYVRLGARNRVLTAWSVAGATMFGEWQNELLDTEKQLARRGKVFVRKRITMEE